MDIAQARIIGRDVATYMLDPDTRQEHPEAPLRRCGDIADWLDSDLYADSDPDDATVDALSRAAFVAYVETVQATIPDFAVVHECPPWGCPA